MSSKLDDLRRRALQHPPPEGIAEPPAEAAVSFKTHNSDASNAEPKGIESLVTKGAASVFPIRRAPRVSNFSDRWEISGNDVLLNCCQPPQERLVNRRLLCQLVVSTAVVLSTCGPVNRRLSTAARVSTSLRLTENGSLQTAPSATQSSRFAILSESARNLRIWPRSSNPGPSETHSPRRSEWFSRIPLPARVRRWT